MPTLVICPGRRDITEHVGDDALRQIVRFDLEQIPVNFTHSQRA